MFKNTLFCIFFQKLFLNAKEADEVLNKKDEGTSLESEVRRMNLFAVLHRQNLLVC